MVFAFPDNLRRDSCITNFSVQAFNRGLCQSAMADGQVLFGIELIGVLQPLTSHGLITDIFHVIRGRIGQGKDTGGVDDCKHDPVNS
ncbi:hypothetical protein D3C72_2320350 [compost metagenome]